MREWSGPACFTTTSVWRVAYKAIGVGVLMDWSSGSCDVGVVLECSFQPSPVVTSFESRQRKRDRIQAAKLMFLYSIARLDQGLQVERLLLITKGIQLRCYE